MYDEVVLQLYLDCHWFQSTSPSIAQLFGRTLSPLALPNSLALWAAPLGRQGGGDMSQMELDSCFCVNQDPVIPQLPAHITPPGPLRPNRTTALCTSNLNRLAVKTPTIWRNWSSGLWYLDLTRIMAQLTVVFIPHSISHQLTCHSAPQVHHRASDGLSCSSEPGGCHQQ